MNLFKGYIRNTFLGIILACVYACFLGPDVIIPVLIGWLLGDLTFVPFCLKNFSFRNVEEQFYFLAYSWQRTWVHMFVALDVPYGVIPQNKLVYFFKYEDDVIKGDYVGLHFFWWNITYFEIRDDEA